ncbi:unnamed protein product [Arctogadus glacialis]
MCPDGNVTQCLIHTNQTAPRGVFAIKFIEKILNGEELQFPVGRKDVAELRRQIATTLLRESDDLTNLCFNCGEENADDSGEAELTWVFYV